MIVPSDAVGLQCIKKLVEEANIIAIDNNMFRTVDSRNDTCEAVNNGIQLRKVRRGQLERFVDTRFRQIEDDMEIQQLRQQGNRRNN
ncbi:hypothetical protein V6N13_048667 [Hibiscus sabdariffa]